MSVYSDGLLEVSRSNDIQKFMTFAELSSKNDKKTLDSNGKMASTKDNLNVSRDKDELNKSKASKMFAGSSFADMNSHLASPEKMRSNMYLIKKLNSQTSLEVTKESHIDAIDEFRRMQSLNDLEKDNEIETLRSDE